MSLFRHRCPHISHPYILYALPLGKDTDKVIIIGANPHLETPDAHIIITCAQRSIKPGSARGGRPSRKPQAAGTRKPSIVRAVAAVVFGCDLMPARWRQVSASTPARWASSSAVMASVLHCPPETPLRHTHATS